MTGEFTAWFKSKQAIFYEFTFHNYCIPADLWIL